MSEGARDPNVFWVDPERRGVFPLDGFHISRSLRKLIRRSDYRIETDRDFPGVVDYCADRDSTWINDELRACYLALHMQGQAHSLEVYRGDTMIGGVFGITMGGAFFGESMFSRQPNGSKLALAHLVNRLRFGGFTLFDTQFVTDHLQSLGAVEIPRAEYRAQLRQALSLDHADFHALPFDMPLDCDPAQI